MGKDSVRWQQDILPLLAPRLVAILDAVPPELLRQVTEIRLRVNRPLLLVLGNNDVWLNSQGQPVTDINRAYRPVQEDIEQTLQLMCQNSLYAFEQELRMGYITVNGGHRVGLVGQSVLAAGELTTLKNISSLNIRIAREVIGCANKVMPYIIADKRRVLSTLIIAPPRCGKTTLLRDIIRQISNGVLSLGFHGVQVGVVDERSEIAACRNGLPTVDMGHRTDVLDGCPKAVGLIMLVRAMSPQVVATDELGREEDARAVQEALHAGVSVIATVHGRDVAEIEQRPFINKLILNRYFDRYIILSDEPHIGAISQVIAVKSSRVLYTARNEVKTCG